MFNILISCACTSGTFQYVSKRTGEQKNADVQIGSKIWNIFAATVQLGDVYVIPFERARK